MLFNSIQFFFFFPVVFLLYLLLKHRWQNRLLIIASCLFYASWNWKFLSIMFLSITTDYFCAKYISQNENPKIRKRLLLLSIMVNLSILAFFKYFNFFVTNVELLLKSIHLISPQAHFALSIILPLGISFYTFEAISYTFDVYKRKTKPAVKYEDYLLFVIYFPHLIAGPIMRAKDFLPQIVSPRQMSLGKLYEGSHLFFWGLFEKMFIADNLAKIVNPVFGNPPPYKGEDVLIALYAFAFQIFCDFDGYSNMARGLGLCMGFEITINFKLPYFSSNPREFWQRWHISLSSWLRDYLYIPLGGNQGTEWRTYINLSLTMLLGGLWHGASWTFVLWGMYQGTLLILHRVITESRKTQDALISTKDYLWKSLKIFIFFHLVIFGWLLFRSVNLHQLGSMSCAMVTSFHWGEFTKLFPKFFLIILPLLAVQIGQLKTGNLMFLFQLPKILKIAVYALMTYLIIGFGVMKAEEFIYFQF